jgi:hypothetical protein
VQTKVWQETLKEESLWKIYAKMGGQYRNGPYKHVMHGLNSSGSGQGAMAGSREQANNPPVSTQCG